MIGIPASTNSIAELAQSQVIVVDGVDLAKRLPTIGGAVIRAKLNGARLIVVGTRHHRVAESADLFLQIKPGPEALLYGAIAKVIVDRGLMDLDFIKTRCRVPKRSSMASPSLLGWSIRKSPRCNLSRSNFPSRSTIRRTCAATMAWSSTRRSSQSSSALYPAASDETEILRVQSNVGARSQLLESI
jgi:anaerobic selenocysteine-containing dehydrogenase